MGTPLCILVFLFSDLISIKIFHLPALSLPLKIFSITIPFLVSLSIFTAIFRGFGRTKEKVYFYDLLRNLLFPLFLVPIIFFGLAFVNAIVAYFASIAVTCIAFAVYYLRKCPKSLRSKDESKVDTSIAKGLLLFSIPLLFVDVMHLVIGWTDTLMLGYFKTAGDVYAVLTKWICAATLPLFMVFLLFPEVTIIFLFGSEYILAGTALQILAFGFFMNNLMGPNGSTLIAMGKTRFLLWATLAAAGTNICLNVLLIPILGILGAAIASMITMISINIITSAKLYLISGIHSLSKNLLKPILLSIILIIAIYLAAESFLTVTFWMLPLLFILFAILYGLSLLFTKSFDQEDINMLLTIEKKMGINFKRIKNLLRRFV
jgi:O-antigen/teichoic acid export membrane protein